MLHMLVTHLDLSVADLVTAVVMLERSASTQRSLLNTFAMRHFFLGCCVISRKINSDVGLPARSGSFLVPVCMPGPAVCMIPGWPTRL